MRARPKVASEGHVATRGGRISSGSPFTTGQRTDGAEILCRDTYLCRNEPPLRTFPVPLSRTTRYQPARIELTFAVRSTLALFTEQWLR